MPNRKRGETVPCPRYSGDEAEEYGFGRLRGQELDEFEEHLLLCETCRERVTDLDTFVQEFRAAASMLPSAGGEQNPESGRSGERESPLTGSSIPGLGFLLGILTLGVYLLGRLCAR